MTHLNFQLQNLNATAEFNILHSSFRIHIVGKRFYTCRLAFELTFFIWPCSLYIPATRQTNFYTLLLFISFDAWTSTLHLTEMPSLLSILTRRIFQLNFWIFVYASVIISRDKRSLCGGGRWRPIDLLPRSFARQHTTSTSSQNTACSVKT